MSALYPTPGELTDRLTILQLKIPAAEAQGKPTDALQEEYEQVAATLNAWQPRCRSREDVELVTERLKTTNKSLWQKIDEVHALPEADANDQNTLMRLAILAKLIARLNDDRAGRIAGLNLLYGIETQELKIFTTA